MPPDTTIHAAESPQPSTKGRCGPVNTLSNNTNLQTIGDLERARAAKAFAPIPYPHDTGDRLCDVAGSIRGARELIEHLPEEIVDYGGGRLVSVLQMLQMIEREVRAIEHGAIELMEATRG
jgi:nucleoside-diphosphate-sugar epimerase